MKNFLKLIETVNEQGGVYVHNPMKDAANDGWSIDPHLSPAFAKMAKECQVFVFSPKNDKPIDLNLSVDASLYSNQFQGPLEVLDAPFTTFSIEILGGPVTSPKPGEHVYTDCIMVHEETNFPLQYWVILLSRMEKPGQEPSYFVSVDLAINLEKSNSDKITVLKIEKTTYLPNQVVLNMVRIFLERLSTESAGQERVNARVKVRSGGHKEIVKIKRLIHITPKSYQKSYSKEGREVDWSHRWFSRGHWRELSGGQLGKNREGLYVEVGRTWVIESVKGPDHKELISKVRMVGK